MGFGTSDWKQATRGMKGDGMKESALAMRACLGFSTEDGKMVQKEKID